MYFLQQCGAPAVRSMSIFFSLLIGCTEVTPVGKRIQKKWDLLSGQGGLVALALPFLLGGVAGCLLALWAGGEGAASLKEYLVDYLSLSASGPVTSVPLGQVLWSSLRDVCLALVLGLTALGVAGLPVLIVFILIIKPRQRRAYQVISNKNSNLNAYVQESIEGVKVTQAFNRQETNLGILDRLIEERRKAWMHAIYISNSVWFSTETISQIVFSLVYIVGAYALNPMASFGVLLAMGTYASKFWQPIVNLANIYNKFVDAMAYLERIFETMNEPPVIEDRPGAEALPPIVGEVRFDHVNFGYEPGQKILRDVSFTAKPGESIAIVGPTGAGKTTIVNLISRFYNIEEGAVLIDGHSVMDVTLHSLRSQMGIMLQDSFVFSGTIADNIRYGRLDATDNDIVRVSKLLCADDFIKKLPRGYKTEVKERGGGLSQGQKQLIAFARTLLADPKILVLDEATSSIDTSTEQLLQRGINLLLQGRTSFIIAHRLSTIRSCTRIMYIDGGEIKEAGSHDELMAKKGYYYDLYMAQYRAEQEEAAG